MKVFLYVLVLLTLINIACNKRITDIGRNINNESIVFPPEPDTPRIQYLTKISGSEDILKKRSKFQEFIFGKRENVNIIKPYGVSVKYGKLYITDAGINGLFVMDLEKRNFYSFIPTGRGNLKKPINCFVDDKDYLYVADAVRNQVVVYNKERNYVGAIGDTGKFRPTDVFVDQDKIYITNSKDHKIQVYKNDSTYKLLYEFPETEPGSDDFLYQPSNLYVSNNVVYVSDIGGFNVKKFSLEGEYINTVGMFGKSPGQFSRNKGIAVDNEENVFVVDAAFENVQIFNREGQILMYFGGPYAGPGYLWLPAKVTVDYDHLKYFQQYVDPRFDLKYLIFVTNQYGPDKITVYGRVELKK